MLRAIALVLALCLVVGGGAAEGKCVVKNKSGQALVIVPVVEAAVEVVVEVGASVVLEASQQHCYLKNKHSGHKKGPVQLANGGVYAIVDATVAGQVNLCIASLLNGILTIGVVILGGV